MAYEQAPSRPRKAARVIRWSVLAIVLVGITIMGYLHQVMGVGKPVGVDALCPMGGLETLGTLVADGFFVKRVAFSSLLLLIAAVATALVFRRVFCGRICPLGYLQELFGGIGRRIFKRRLTLPAVLDRPARYLKYVVLFVILYFTWRTATLVIRPYDPWVAYQHLTSAELLTEFGVGFAVLAISLVGSIVYDRFFCKYACPMGAFLGLISRLSVFKIRRNTETCIDCKLCDRACPVNITVSEVETVMSAECIDCGECVSACPVKDTLATSAGNKATLGPVTTAALSVGLFALLVAIATLLGGFQWTTQSLRERAENPTTEFLGIDVPSEQGQGALPLSGTGEGSEAGAAATAPEAATGDVIVGVDGLTFDTALIKGSTTLAEVIDVSGIPGSVFTQVYGVPESEYSQQLKVLKDIYGCYPGEIRGFVSAYLADPGIVDGYSAGDSHAEEEEDH